MINGSTHPTIDMATRPTDINAVEARVPVSYLGEQRNINLDVTVDKGFRNGGIGYNNSYPNNYIIYRTAKNVGSDTVDFTFTLKETEEYAAGIVIVTFTNTNLSDVFDIQ